MSVKKHLENKSHLDKEEKAAIKKAVSEIPSLILKEMQENKKNETDEITEKKDWQVSEQYDIEKKKRIWLWSGITIFAIIIFAIWGINLSNTFRDVKFDSGQEQKILEQSKKDLQNIFQTTNKKTETENIGKKEDLKDQIKNKLTEIITPLLNELNKNSSTEENIIISSSTVETNNTSTTKKITL